MLNKTENYEYSFSNIQFIKVGDFYIVENPWSGTDKKYDYWEVFSKCRLTDQRFLKVYESCYLVTSGSKPMYVGEFIYTLEDRWFRNTNGYVNHHLWREIETELRNGSEVSR